MPDHRRRPPNRLLVEARKRLPSPSGAPRPMSRQELAEKINTYVWEHHRIAEHLDHTDIGKLERGFVRWPGQHRREALRAVLGASTDNEIGLYIAWESPSAGGGDSPGPARLDTTMALGGDLVSAPTDIAHELRERLAGSAAVDDGVLSLLLLQADHIREADRRLGARIAQAQMRGHLAALDELLTFAVSAGRREPLADLYSDAASLAGWQALDLDDLDGAWRHHEAAKSAGREGSSPAALSHAMAQQAYVLVELGDLDNAILLADHARTTAGSAVPALLRAWLRAVQGELYATAGDRPSCIRSFENAGRLLPADPQDPALPYIVLSEIHLARWRGNALARLGDPTATDDLRLVLDRLDSTFTRARAGVHVDLAHALLAAGQRTEAAAQLRQGDALAGRVGSARQRRRIHHLASVLQAA